MDAILLWKGWVWFFLAWCLFSIWFAARPLADIRGRHQMLGADIILIEWVITYFTRDYLGEPWMVVTYSSIDAVFGIVFAWIALKHRAVWAAVCVLTHLGMGLAHLYQYLGLLSGTFAYVLALNVFTALSLVSNNTGVWAGRYDQRRILDRAFHHLRRRWTFSGFRLPFDPSDYAGP